MQQTNCDVEELVVDDQDSFTSCEGSINTKPSTALTLTTKYKRLNKRKTDDELVSIAKQCLSDIKNIANEGGSESRRPTELDEDERYGLHVAAEMKKVKLMN